MAPFAVLAASMAVAQFAADGPPAFFRAWDSGHRTVRSLVVEFKFTAREPRTGKADVSDGTFRMARTPSGRVSQPMRVSMPSPLLRDSTSPARYCTGSIQCYHRRQPLR